MLGNPTKRAGALTPRSPTNSIFAQRALLQQRSPARIIPALDMLDVGIARTCAVPKGTSERQFKVTWGCLPITAVLQGPSADRRAARRPTMPSQPFDAMKSRVGPRWVHQQDGNATMYYGMYCHGHGLISPSMIMTSNVGHEAGNTNISSSSSSRDIAATTQKMNTIRYCTNVHTHADAHACEVTLRLHSTYRFRVNTDSLEPSALLLNFNVGLHSRPEGRTAAYLPRTS